MKILAFESSCDETAVAVVEDGRTVLSDAIASQADLHALYGGVVPELASRKLFPTAEEIICGDFTSIKDHLTVTEEDFVVIMTNGHMHDFHVEEQILRGPFAYVGVIGSRTKTASVNQRLREAGIPEESIAPIHTPIGTAIRAVTPAEIAVSIAGEMILCRAERRGDKPHGCPMH